MSTLICPKCNYKTEGNEQLCCKCGTMLAVVPEKAFCSSCGAELKPDAEFCPQCGEKANAFAMEGKDVGIPNRIIEPKQKEKSCISSKTANEIPETAISTGTTKAIPDYSKMDAGILKKEAERGNADVYLRLLKVAEQGHIPSLKRLAKYYLSGKDGEKNKQKAQECYRKLAEHYLAYAESGNIYSQYCLAACYDYGIGVKQSPAEAVKWYRLAAEQGDDLSQERLKKGKFLFKICSDISPLYFLNPHQGLIHFMPPPDNEFN